MNGEIPSVSCLAGTESVTLQTEKFSMTNSGQWRHQLPARNLQLVSALPGSLPDI